MPQDLGDIPGSRPSDQAQGLGRSGFDPDRLGDIADQIEWWMRRTREDHQREGLALTRDTHVIPAVWPSYGQLSNWVEALRGR